MDYGGGCPGYGEDTGEWKSTFERNEVKNVDAGKLKVKAKKKKDRTNRSYDGGGDSGYGYDGCDFGDGGGDCGGCDGGGGDGGCD